MSTFDDRRQQIDERLGVALWNLQLEIAVLAIYLPDLPERHTRLIDNVLRTVKEWDEPILDPVTRLIPNVDR